jgi:hypothetical protein
VIYLGGQNKMLANIIGKKTAQLESNLFLHIPEYRLKSLRGQDRSVNVNSYARETDNRNPIGIDIQSELSTINKMEDNTIGFYSNISRNCFVTNCCTTGWDSSG